MLVAPLLLLAGAGSASAHAALRGTDPADGSVLKTAPKAVTLTFTEAVGLLDNSIRVFDPENRRVHTGKQEHADGHSHTARVTLPDLKQGTYIVAWRVVSADSHPVSGALTFSVGKRSATRAALPDDEVQDAASTALYNTARYIAYGGLALLLGATAFAMVTGVAAPRGLLVGGWWTLLAATLALLLLRGPYERGSGPAAAFDLTVLRETATSRPGLALLVRVALLAVAAPVAARAGVLRAPADGRGPVGSGRLRFAIVSLLSLALALTWAVAEHASAGIQVPLAMTSAVLHLLAMAVWLGGLTALVTVVQRTPGDLPAPAVARFSRLAFAAVAVLAATGAYQSWRGLGSLDALTSTPYGRLLVAKLAGVALLLAAAGCSRRFTARLAVPAAKVPAAPPERVRETVGAASGDADAAHVGKAARVRDASHARGAEGVRDAVDVRTDTDTDPQDAPTGPAPGDGARAPHLQALRRSVLAEISLGLVVLAVTTLLTGTQPGRAAEEAAASTAAEPPLGSATVIPFDVGTPGGHGKVQIELTPGRVGENGVQALIFGPDGGIATVPELRLTFTLEGRDVGPLDARLTDRGGYWATDTLDLPLPGRWTMRATVRTSDIDQVTVSKTVRIG
ncbi:copper resistance protein CopC [Streptomyces cynarae]|uniref:Copper resistance protein CopC n=1 Tax=Streptomyces cynarae TaxID=2981134 RepID=A0ABY6ECY0_9ACTN|nr:copper resistance protein CopC [Streptomyces cynarae]UXY24589.1 copper resistance protein CopC [Streptomyces cynarae]